MTIGLAVPNIATKVLPDKSLSKASTPGVLVAKFGDGYQQRIANGLNSIKDTFSITLVNRPKLEADDIEAFFSLKKGVTAFDFTYPDTNSTTVATSVINSVQSTTQLTLTASAGNINISTGSVVTGTGISGTTTVASISGTALLLSVPQSLSSSTELSFTNPNERQVKVICNSWQIAFSNSNHYNINAEFERVYEP